MVFQNLSKNEQHVLDQLLKNARATDSEICDRTGLSRSTVAKIRKKIEDEKIISAYIPMPNPKGTVLVFTTYRWVNFSADKEKEAFEQYVRSRNDVVSFSKGSGFRGATHIVISHHESMHGYEEMMQELRTRMKQNAEILDNYITSPEMQIKTFDEFVARLAEE